MFNFRGGSEPRLEVILFIEITEADASIPTRFSSRRSRVRLDCCQWNAPDYLFLQLGLLLFVEACLPTVRYLHFYAPRQYALLLLARL
jgi:hypothetical protein